MHTDHECEAVLDRTLPLRETKEAVCHDGTTKLLGAAEGRRV